MNEKLARIHWLLHRECAGRLARYVATSRYHSFRLEGNGPTHWLHIPRELVSELDAVSLDRLLLHPDCVGRLNEATRPTRLCLLSAGACEVSDGSLAFISQFRAITDGREAGLHGPDQEARSML